MYCEQAGRIPQTYGNDHDNNDDGDDEDGDSCGCYDDDDDADDDDDDDEYDCYDYDDDDDDDDDYDVDDGDEFDAVVTWVLLMMIVTVKRWILLYMMTEVVVMIVSLQIVMTAPCLRWSRWDAAAAVLAVNLLSPVPFMREANA